MSNPEIPKPELFVDVGYANQMVGKLAVDDYIESGGHPADIYNLPRALEDQAVPLVNNAAPNNATREEVLEQARFILGTMGKGNSAKGLRLHIQRRAHHLGIAVDDYYLNGPGMFGGLRGLQRELGLDDIDKRFRFSDYDLEDILDHLQMVEGEEEKRPTVEILWRRIREEKKDEITPRTITKQIALSEALEFLGYPNIRSWKTNEEFEIWGVDYTLANGRLPNRVSMGLLSAEDRSPSPSIASVRFERINIYKSKVWERLENEIQTIRQELDAGLLPPSLFSGVRSLADAVKRYRIFNLVNSLAPRADVKGKVFIATGDFKGSAFVAAINRYARTTSKEKVIDTARHMGSFPYIFVRGDYLAKLQYEPHTKPHRDYERYEKRVLKEISQFEDNHVGGVRITKTRFLASGFFVRTLESQRPEEAYPPGSPQAIAAIKRATWVPGTASKFTIFNSKGSEK